MLSIVLAGTSRQKDSKPLMMSLQDHWLGPQQQLIKPYCISRFRNQLEGPADSSSINQLSREWAGMCPRTHNPSEAVVDADRAFRASGRRKWPSHAHTEVHILLLPLETRVPLLQHGRTLLTFLCFACLQSLQVQSTANQVQLGLGVLNNWEKLCVPL